tara:strand:- start:1328 stop:1771 length:444 start_codon:yes stop_codon:yes gene_type:complete
MPVFIQINESFTLGDMEDEKPIIKQFKKNKADTISLVTENVHFKCGLYNLVDGDLLITESGKGLDINCDATFKINIKPQHKDLFLNPKSKWKYQTIQQGEFGDELYGAVTEGLRSEKRKEKNMNGEFEIEEFFMNNIKTGIKKTDFK